MAYTYSKIASYTVGSGGISSVNFLAIPQNYTDLVAKVSVRTTRANALDILNMTFNGSSTNQTARILYGNGASPVSTVDTNIWAGITTGDSATANTFGNSEFYIPNYTSLNYKSLSINGVNETNATTAFTITLAGLWSSSDAITSIGFLSSTGSTLMQYSTFTLYGVKAEV